MTRGQLKQRAIDRLRFLHGHTLGIGIIPHPAQVSIYEELLLEGLCTVVARAWKVGEVGSLDTPEDRRSYR